MEENWFKSNSRKLNFIEINEEQLLDILKDKEITVMERTQADPTKTQLTLRF